MRHWNNVATSLITNATFVENLKISAGQHLKNTIKDTDVIYLWYDYVSQSTGQSEKFPCVLQVKRGIMLKVIFDAVVDIRDLADVVAPILHAEVSLQLRPAL